LKPAAEREESLLLGADIDFLQAVAILLDHDHGAPEFHESLRRTGQFFQSFQTAAVAGGKPVATVRGYAHHVLSPCLHQAAARFSGVRTPRASARIIHVKPHQSATQPPWM
jgi:hypothetical protein